MCVICSINYLNCILYYILNCCIGPSPLIIIIIILKKIVFLSQLTKVLIFVLIFIRGIDLNFNVSEELVELCSLKGTTIRESEKD